MSTIVKLTGFSGHIIVDGVQLLSGSASISEDGNPAFNTFIDVARDTTPRSKVLYSPGTRVVNGSISFDVTANAMTLLQTNKLFQRRYTFDVKVFDGIQGKEVDDCMVTSLSLSGSVGGLITASLSFVSANLSVDYDGSDGVFINPKIVAGDTGDGAAVPYGYWYSGSTDAQVKDWSLSYTQSVTPIYLNQIDDAHNSLPRYLKATLQDTELNLDTYDEVPVTKNDITIATNTFSIVGVRVSGGYTFNGPNDIGSFTHHFSSAAVTSPTEDVLST